MSQRPHIQVVEDHIDALKATKNLDPSRIPSMEKPVVPTISQSISDDTRMTSDVEMESEETSDSPGPAASTQDKGKQRARTRSSTIMALSDADTLETPEDTVVTGSKRGRGETLSGTLGPAKRKKGARKSTTVSKKGLDLSELTVVEESAVDLKLVPRLANEVRPR